MDYDKICFNIAAFTSGLFVLEHGANKFIDHTAKVASRLNVPATLIALLTAGAEWEELVVVVAAISQSQSKLAIGNVIGSSISNIMGAFSLGLIFSPQSITFDRSSKIYTSVLLVLTTFIILFVHFLESIGRAAGVALVATFVIYNASIAWAIFNGMVTPPEDDSNSDSDSDSDSNLGFDVQGARGRPYEKSIPLRSRSPSINGPSSTTIQQGETDFQDRTNSPLALDVWGEVDIIRKSHTNYKNKSSRSTLYHVVQLVLGFLALSLSGYLLSHSITTLGEELSVSSTVLGMTFLSFATTLPEKLVAIFSGSRQQGGIMIANTVGSNIFLATLCTGVLFLEGDLGVLEGSVNTFELMAMWVSALLLFGVVMIGGKKWMGWCLLAIYFAFLVLEFTVNRE